MGDVWGGVEWSGVEWSGMEWNGLSSLWKGREIEREDESITGSASVTVMLCSPPIRPVLMRTADVLIAAGGDHAACEKSVHTLYSALSIHFPVLSEIT